MAALRLTRLTLPLFVILWLQKCLGDEGTARVQDKWNNEERPKCFALLEEMISAQMDENILEEAQHFCETSKRFSPDAANTFLLHAVKKCRDLSTTFFVGIQEARLAEAEHGWREAEQENKFLEQTNKVLEAGCAAEAAARRVAE